MGSLKAVDASPKELAKLLFEIAPEEFVCLENAERAMEIAVQEAEREPEILANHPSSIKIEGDRLMR